MAFFCLVGGDFKVGLPQTVVGLLFLTAGIKGRLPKWLDSEEREKEYEKQISEGKSVTRKICLLSLGGLVLTVAILTSVFLTTELFSVGWWIAIVLTIFSSIIFYLNSTILLENKGFNSLLTFTVVFPVILLAIGVINPKKFDEINLA